VTTDLVPYAHIARAAASNDVAGLAEALDSIDADVGQVAATLLRFRLGQLVLATLSPAALDDHPVAVELRAFFERHGVALRSDPAEHLRAFAEIRDVLVGHDIPVLLLKGVVLARRLYGGIDRRPQHDVDLLVHRHDARRAGQLVRSLGYARQRRDSHAVTMQRGAVQVDLHRRLRSAPAYGIDETAAWRTAHEEMIAGTRLRTLSDETTLALIVTSLVEDIAFGMAKMTSLCDIWLLLRHLDATTDWEAWFSQRAEEGLDAIAVNGGALALVALDGAGDAPNFMRAVRQRAHHLRVRDRAHALELTEAAKGSAANMAWMGQIYPGRLLAFRLHPFVSGLPGTLRGLRGDWARRQLALLRSRRVLRATR
jgi:hypothetical protein